MQSIRNIAKKNKLAIESEEIFGKIEKNKHCFEEGRKSSGRLRKTFWKGVRLTETYS
jgi:hypothetical protein